MPEDTKKWLGSWLVLLITLVLIVVFAYGSWRVYRYINWSWGYESKTEDVVRRMVKPECLR